MPKSTQDHKSSNKNLKMAPTSQLDMNNFFLPKIRKIRAVHSKDPFKIKCKPPLPPELKYKPKKLNGFNFLKMTKSELPHEIIKANLSCKNIVDIMQEDLRFFLNLTELDISENQVKLEQLLNLVNLKNLNLQANQIYQIDLNESKQFQHLEWLNLSFNFINFQTLTNLQFIPNLRYLDLSGNNLQELPENLSMLQNLQILIINNNNFNSEYQASNLWQSLASIGKLEQIDISRNYLRGIHTEKLIAGNFSNLNILDFSYNIVDNQHNLICARNFKNLKQLIVTGNPFAEQKQAKGLEMEIYARIGAKLINESVEKPYLPAKNVKTQSIQFSNNMVRLVEQIVKKGDKTYYLGVDWLGYQPEEKEEQTKNIEQNEQQTESQEESFEQQDEDANLEENQFFLTEKNSKKKKQTQKSKSSSKNNNNNTKNQQSSQELQKETQSKNTILQQMRIDYQDFKRQAKELLGDSIEYNNPLELQSAYKALKSMIRKPQAPEYQDGNDPNYLKSTLSIKRFQFESQQSKQSSKQHEDAHRSKQISSNFSNASDPLPSLNKSNKHLGEEQDQVQQILNELNKKMKSDLNL